MTFSPSIVGTLAAGSEISATGDFNGSGCTDILWKQSNGSYVLWLMQKSGTISTVTINMPSGYSVIGAGHYDPSKPGLDELLVKDGLGNLFYASYSPSPNSTSALASFVVSSSGRIGSAAGGIVVASANFNTCNYFGNSQVLLQSGTMLYAMGSNLAAFSIPNGFSVVPGGVGHFFGADLPATLLVNASGTVEALMEGGTVTVAGVTTNVAVSNVIGTLQPGETIVAVGGLNSDGSTDIVTQQSGILFEWVVDNGVTLQKVTLGPLPSGFTVAGVGDFDGNGASDIVLTNDAGTVEVIRNTPSFTGNSTLLDTVSPVIAVSGNYSVVTNARTNSTLSDYFVGLAASVSLSAIGVRILTVQQGALSNCSYEQVVAGNLTLAAWQQNVAALNAFAQYCRDNAITVQVETQLGWTGHFGAAQTYQWLNPALAAGLPIGYVVDNLEFPDWGSLNVTTMAQNELQDIQIIHAALPNAVFGEWEIMGAPDPHGSVSSYHKFLQNWYSTLNSGARLLNLPGISYIIADQYYSAELAANKTVSETGQVPGLDVPVNGTADLIRDAAAVGVKVEIQVAMSDTDLNPLQALARQELQISQEAMLGIAGMQLSGSFSHLPVSNAVNVPGSTFNGAAEIAAITPLYQMREITTAGAISLSAPAQLVTRQGVTTAIAGVLISVSAQDQAKKIAVVLIDQTGTLSAAQCGGATVSHIGSNELILNGTPEDVAAELASLTINEAVAGPDSIDVEVFGLSGRVAGTTIAVVATQSDGSTSFSPSSAGTLPQLWQSASAVVSGGVITSESFTWAASNGLSAGGFIGGTTIAPVTQILVAQPLMERDLSVSGGVASLSAADLSWTNSAWAIYDPLNPGASTSEQVPVIVTASTLSFDPVTGKLQNRTDVLASVAQSAYGALFPFTDAAHPYYFAAGGTAVTQYNTGDNPDWPTANGNSLYANGAGIVTLIANGSTMVIAYGSTNTMVVDSIQTISGIVNGERRVLEVRYQGGPSNPYDEVDQIFDPYSATPELWQQINTVGIPVSMAGSSPLPIPSATTVTEFNTGDNPDWNSAAWGNHKAVATTFENGNWISIVGITANGSVVARRGVTWIGEGKILNAYTLDAPSILSYTNNARISGTGIAGDWVVVTDSTGKTLGSARVAATGTWQVTPNAGPTVVQGAVQAQQFDFAGNRSQKSTIRVSSPSLLLHGPSSEYIIADDGGSLHVQDVAAGRDGKNSYYAASNASFTDGIGVFDPTGNAEDVARIYLAALGRTPDLVGLEYWTVRVDNSVVPLSAMASRFTTSPEFIQHYGSLSDSAFVNQLYENVLGRPVDAAGGQYWNGVLASGASRGTVVLNFAESPENKAKTLSMAGDVSNAEAYRLYQAAFGRKPDAAGEQFWSSALDDGATPTQVAQGFISSSEFQQDYGALTESDFVSALYQNVLRRAGDVGGLQYWTSQLQRGSSEASVLVGFSDSLENRIQTASATHANWVFIPS